MGRPRVFKTSKKLEAAWEEYKQKCDTNTVKVWEYNKNTKKWVETEIVKPVTYTIEGFCVWSGLTRQAFYKNYMENEGFVDMATRLREECEVDQRQKFETDTINPKLAGLWMGRWGYSSKPEERNEASGTVVFTGESELED